MYSKFISSNTNLNLVAPNPYDAVSVSFIQQAHRNTKYFDSNMSEYIRDIDRIEFTVNNSAFGPLTYPIITPAYQDSALNYLKSLQGDEMKNFPDTILYHQKK